MGERGISPDEVASLELPSLLHPFQRDAAIRMELGKLGVGLVPRPWGLYLQRSQLHEAATEVSAANTLADLSTPPQQMNKELGE